MDYVWFILWLGLLTGLIWYIPFFNKLEITRIELVLLLLIKFTVSLIYFAFFYYYIKNGDCLGYYFQGYKFHDIIKTEGWGVWWNIITEPNIGGYPEERLQNKYYLNAVYWSNNGSLILSRMEALLHVIAGHSPFTHSLIYAWLSFVGLCLISKVSTILTHIKLRILLYTITLFPSILFWGSGMHKESLMHLILGIIIYSCYQFKTGKFYHIFLGIISAIILLYMRNYALLLLLPPMIAWIITFDNKKKVWLKYIVIYVLFFFTAWQANNYFYGGGLINKIVHKQWEFTLSEGASSILKQPIHPDLKHLIAFIPTAVYHGFFRPTLFDIYKFEIAIEAIEILLFWIIVAYLLIFYRNKKLSNPSWFWFLMSYSASYIIMLGVVVNTFGAIVRYKAVVLPLIVIALLMMIDTNKIELRLRSTVSKISKKG